MIRASDLGPCATDVVAEVEASSCSRGCVNAVPADGLGPGGSCPWLAATYAELEVPFRWKAKALICEKRRGLPRAATPIPAAQEALW